MRSLTEIRVFHSKGSAEMETLLKPPGEAALFKPPCMQSNATAGGSGELDKSFPADSDLCHSALVTAVVHLLNWCHL